ncbi:unnamed protein product [Clonostachys rosea]|uniref:DUF676 domain-containing protein n=1 Tax=Bionectria ochroleuca TaxID=29856 RepID=A0ABY6UU00_BIOOC|nr:unnamed protein product [Clonostachys rosea]
MDEMLGPTQEAKDAAAALDARVCQFEIDGGSNKLGRHEGEPPTKAAHVELFNYGVIASVSSLTYGTWEKDDAALLVLVLNFRSPDSGILRFTKAELSVDFKKQRPEDGSPVVRLCHPTSNRISATNDHNTDETPGLWPPAAYSIKGSSWSKQSQEEAHQVFWEVSIPRGSSADINNNSIPLCAVVSFRGFFMATVRLKATTALKLKLESFPWSKKDPMLFNGHTSKGKQFSNTNFFDLKKRDIEKHLPRQYTKQSNYKSTTGANSLTPIPGTVCRIHGIPISDSAYGVSELLSKALDISSASMQIKTFSRNPNHEEITALVSFTSFPTTLKRTQPGRWQISVPSIELSRKGEIHASPPSSSSNPSLDLYLDTNFLGFTNLSPLSPGPPSVDIVAVHGLGGHAYGSFKQRGGHYMWLNDSLYVDLCNIEPSEQFPQGIKPRILLYGHDSHIEQSQTFQSLEDLATELKVLLRGVRRQDPTRPLILIGHSLGGLLIKQLLIQWAVEEGNAIDTSTREATIGLLLFGVPSRGMNINALLEIAGEQPNAEFISSLGIGSPILEEQAKAFPELCKSTKMHTYSFYETRLSNTARKIDGKLSITGKSVVLVDKASATHGRPWEMNTQFIIPIQRTHSDLVKFDNPSPEYEKVRGCLIDILGSGKSLGHRVLPLQ